MRNATDLITNAIEDAVERTLERMLPKLIREAMPELKNPVPQPRPVLDGERFYSIKAVGERLGVSRSAILRWERAGKMPKRRTLPSGRTGWLASDIEGFLSNLTPKKREMEPVN